MKSHSTFRSLTFRSLCLTFRSLCLCPLLRSGGFAVLSAAATDQELANRDAADQVLAASMLGLPVKGHPFFSGWSAGGRSGWR